VDALGEPKTAKRKNMILTHRKAKIADLPRLIELLLEDELGNERESKSSKIDENYIKAFHKIDNNPNQYLMVIEKGNEIIGSCHLTIMPSLTFIGSTRMQIGSASCG
jgi:N-acetylglutamate synthase-like GNAT family acetyltransferase